VGPVPGPAPGPVPGPVPGPMPAVMPGGGQVGPPGWLPPAPRRASRDWSTIAVVTVAIVVVAAAGGFAWLKFGRQSGSSARLGAESGVSAQGQSASPSASASPTPTPASIPSVTPTPTSSASTLVPVGPGVSSDAQTNAVDAFVTEYFSAINNHN